MLLARVVYLYLQLLLFVHLSSARPEPPLPPLPRGYSYTPPPVLPTVSNNYGPPPTPSDDYGPPPAAPNEKYTGTTTSNYNTPASQYGPPPSQTYGPPPAQETIIHKHVYVHVAPPEPEYEQLRSKIIMPPPVQKHYKIVFIKAPSPPKQQAPVLPPIQQSEEKTLVYVLVKKPDEQPDIVIPTPAPTQPSKPEVYFIRYKTKKQEGSNGGYPKSQPQQQQLQTSYGTPVLNYDNETGSDY